MDRTEAVSVSVVIPAYNAEATIAGAIESALQQTHPPTELIVVDDGSQDATARIVEDGFGSRVHLIRRANGGASSARNAGTLAATGEFVAFLDADDIWLPRKLEAQLGALSEFPESSLCYTDAELSDGRVRGLSYPVFKDHAWTYRDVFSRQATISVGQGTFQVHEGRLFKYLLYNGMILPSSALVRRSFLQDHELTWDESARMGHDALFFLQASRHTPLTFVDAPLIKYRSPVDGESRLSANQNNPVRIAVFIEGIQRIAEESGFLSEDPAWVDHCLANSHRRLGYHYLSDLRLRLARSPFRTALGYEPGDLKTSLLLLASYLPAWAVRALGGVKRTLYHGVDVKSSGGGATA